MEQYKYKKLDVQKIVQYYEYIESNVFQDWRDLDVSSQLYNAERQYENLHG